MDVQPETLLQHRNRNHEPVCDDDNRRRAELETDSEALGLQHRDSEPLGGVSCGRYSNVAPTPCLSVGSGEHAADLVTLGQPLEHIGAERRRCGDGDRGH